VAGRASETRVAYVRPTSSGDVPALGFFAASPDYIGEDIYRLHYGALDPRRRLIEHVPGRRLLRCHEHFDEGFVRRSEFYQDFALRHGRRFLLGARLARTDEFSAFAGLHRTPEQGPFDDNDLSFFERVKPHLERAAQIQNRINEIEGASRAANAVLDQLTFGILTADKNGRIVSTNLIGQEVLASGDGLVARGGRLTVTHEDMACRLVEALRSATEPRDGTARRGVTLLIERPSGKAPFRLLIAPLPESGNNLLEAAKGATALILITDPERIATVPGDHLRSIFRLTKGEAQVALGIVAGKTADEIAEERGVSVGTVRTQLKALLQKTGTDRQAELVRLLLTIPTVATQLQRPGSS
jgi:DNA-binding CsgD family transcriptional regulator